MFRALILHKISCWSIRSSLVLGCSIVNADLGISGAFGHGVSDLYPFRVGIQYDWNMHRRQNFPFALTGYWEGSYYKLQGGQREYVDTPIELNAYVLSAVLRFKSQTKLLGGMIPYLDIGIGFSHLTERELRKRKLGSYFQFEDRLGLGLLFGYKNQYDISYRLVHFSNAYLGGYNDGINLQLFVIGFWF